MQNYKGDRTCTVIVLIDNAELRSKLCDAGADTAMLQGRSLEIKAVVHGC